MLSGIALHATMPYLRRYVADSSYWLYVSPWLPRPM